MKPAASLESDGSRIVGGRLRGLLHTEDLDEAFELGDQDVCQVAESLGAACVPCSDGVTQTCVSVWVEDLGGERVQEGALIERSQADIDADLACQAP